jgi:hypothetical protein
MAEFLFTFIIIVLFIVAGVMINVRLRRRQAPGTDIQRTGHYRWTRRVRSLPGSTETKQVIEEETVVEREV